MLAPRASAVTTLLLGLLALSPAFALPAPQEVDETDTALSAPAPGNSTVPFSSINCSLQYAIASTVVSVKTYGVPAITNDPRGCGEDLRGHLWDQCGVLSVFSCSPNPKTNITTVTTLAPLLATDKCVRDAIWLTTKTPDVECEGWQ